MPDFATLQTNFTSGEFDPRLKGRTDIKKYINAVETLTGFAVMPFGGATRIPGTRYVATVKDSSKNTRVIPFQYSLTQAYTIEVGAGYFRFYMNEAQIMDPGTPTIPYEIANTYTDGEILQLTWEQSADVLYIYQGNHMIQKLMRYAHDNWGLVAYDPQDGPYLNPNITAITLAPSATTGNITITASADLFAATDVGRLVRMLHGALWGYAKITGYTTAQLVNATVVNAFGGTGAVTDWRLGAWSDTTGYPTRGAFHNGRLYSACTRTQPQWKWGSVVNDYENHRPSGTDGVVADDDAVSKEIDTSQVNAIAWINSAKRLSFGTTDAEFTGSSGSTTDDIITPSAYSFLKETKIGSALYKPVLMINNSIIFPQYMGKKVFEYVYKFEYDQFVAVELSLLSQHMFKDGIDDLTYQQEPYGIIWFASGGYCIGCTYLREQDVVAFYRYPLGGVNPSLKSLATIENPEATQNQVWMVVSRTINGATVKTIEFIDDFIDYSDLTNKEDCYFLTCGLSYDGASTTTLAGLDHLIGEEVGIVADGIYVGKKKVNLDGKVFLVDAASKAHVGFNTYFALGTLPMADAPAAVGTTMGKIKRIHRVVIKLYQTDLSFKVGYDANNLEPVSERNILRR